MVSCYGVRIGIRTNTDDAYEQAIARLPQGTRPVLGRTTRHLYSLLDGRPGKRRGLKPFSLLYRNASKIVRSLDFEEAIDTLESDLRATIAKHAPRRIFLKGNAFQFEGAVVIVCEADSSEDDSSETADQPAAASLIDTLLERGAVRLTHDFTPLNRRGVLTEFATGGGSLDRPQSYTPNLIVSARRGSANSLQPLSKTFAILQLTGHVATALKPGAVVTSLSSVIRRLPTVSLEYHQADQAVEQLSRWIAAR